MGSYAALAVDQAASDRFACREEPAPPYDRGGPRGRPVAGIPGRFPVAIPPERIPPAPLRPVTAPAPAVERAVRVADGMALALRAALDQIAVPLARSAAAFVRRQDWCVFGFARLDDHARERLGRSGRWLRDLALLGESLEKLPALEAALTGEDGGRPIGRVAATAVARVADPASLPDWIERARSLTV